LTSNGSTILNGKAYRDERFGLEAGLMYLHNRTRVYASSVTGPFGQPLASNGSAILTGKGYIDERFDPETGLMFLHKRTRVYASSVTGTLR
jgi:hypothetical protein